MCAMVPDNFYGYSAVELEGNNFYYVGCNVVIFFLLHCISIVVIAAGFRYYIVFDDPCAGQGDCICFCAGFLDVNDYLELHVNMGGTKFTDVQELNYRLP